MKLTGWLIDMKIKTKRLVLISLFIAIGIVLQSIENSFPIISGIPGGKLGLANIVSILNILMFGGINALIVAAIRSIITSLLFGGIGSLMYSLCGAVLSTLSMTVFMKLAPDKFGLMSVGIVGGVTHNIAQVTVASVALSSGYIWSYLPVLMIIGALSGSVTGISASLISSKIKFK